MNLLFGVLGLIGGVLCACGDLLLDLKGKDNKKLGKRKFIDSNWEKMPLWRFKGSILLAMVGVPLYFLGMTSLAWQLEAQNQAFGQAFWIVSLIGSIGGFFIHAFVCAMPAIYKTMVKSAGFSLTEEVINQVYGMIRIPFFFMYILLVGVTSLMLAYAVWANYLSISPFMLLLTPLCLLTAGVVLRRVKPGWFYDLPGIIMPSMGLGMIGLMAALNASVSF